VGRHIRNLTHILEQFPPAPDLSGTTESSKIRQPGSVQGSVVPIVDALGVVRIQELTFFRHVSAVLTIQVSFTVPEGVIRYLYSASTENAVDDCWLTVDQPAQGFRANAITSPTHTGARTPHPIARPYYLQEGCRCIANCLVASVMTSSFMFVDLPVGEVVNAP